MKEVFAPHKVDSVEAGNKLIKKFRKLLKIKKLFGSLKSAKLRKKSSKYENLSKFDAKKTS